MKHQTKKILVVSLILVGIILSILILSQLGVKIFPKTFATIPYVSQCSVSSCPSGYSQDSLYCSDTAEKCYRVCKKQLPGSCGTYGSFSQVKQLGMSYSKSNRGISYNTGYYSVDSSYCYKFYSESRMSVSSWGTANSYNLYSANSWNSKTSCSTSSSATSTTSTYTLGRGSNGNSYSGAGKVTDFGNNACSNGYPIIQLTGTLNIGLYASKASWIEGGYDTQTLSCSYDCDEVSDCGVSGLTGSTFCKNSNVYQMYRSHLCSNYDCSYSDSEQLVSTCSYGCTNGACVSVACVNGDEKCEGTNHFICSANNWNNEGFIIGKCGASCTEKEIIQQSSVYYICVSGTYKPVLDVLEFSLEEQQEIFNLINKLNASIEEKSRIINELTTNLQGQITIINQLNYTIEQKAKIISNLQLTLSEQATLINSLNVNVQEKSVIINNLNLNIQEQALLIGQLTQKRDEQAEIINNLNLDIQEQAIMINTLTANLEEKARLVSLLQVENEEQARLIEEMRLSFSEQGIIIENLHLTISEDAKIIQSLNLNINEQAILISNLRLTNEEQAQLINNLNLKISDQVILINSFNNKISEDAVIIKNLENSVGEQAQLIKELKLTTDEQVELIARLNLDLETEKKLVAELILQTSEQQILIDKLKQEKIEIQKEKNTIVILSIIGVILLIGVLTFLLVKMKKRR